MGRVLLFCLRMGLLLKTLKLKQLKRGSVLSSKELLLGLLTDRQLEKTALVSQKGIYIFRLECLCPAWPAGGAVVR